MSSRTFPRQTSNLGRQLSWRILLLSLFALLGSLGGMVSSGVNRLKSVQEQLDTTSAEAALAFDSFLVNIGNDLQVTSDVVHAAKDVNEVLRRTLNRQDFFLELLLVDPEGQVLVRYRWSGAVEPTSTRVEQPWLQTVKTDQVYYGPVNFDETGTPFMHIATAVTDKQQLFSATLVAQVNLTPLWNLAIRRQVGENGYIYITDEKDHLLAYPDSELVQSGVTLQELVGRVPQSIAQSSSNFYSGIRGERVIAAGTPLQTVPWFAIAEQPVGEALRPLARFGLIFVMILLTASTLVLNIILFTRRWIISRLFRLHEGVEMLGQGDLAHRIDLKTQDELGALAGAFNVMSEQLQEMVETLAQRIAERTRDLEHRSVQLEAASQVARDAAAIRDVGQLLNETANLISDRFGFYHAGIFLLDERGEYAVLQAASSEGGQRMLARGHRLRVGSVGIVGYAARMGAPRIALNVGVDVVYFDNPDLPLTRSEMALPLKVRDQVIGVLDVQSTDEDAFSEEDVTILGTLADQVALAIENARLLEESQRTLQELDAFHGQRVRQDWQEQIARQAAAYRYTRAGVTPAASSMPAAPQEEKSQLVAPIRLREEAFGSIVLSQDPDQDPWSPEELAMLQEVSDQVALALENARLLDATRRRAAQERLISEITAHVRESLDLDIVLQTAVREIGEALNIAEVEVRMGSGGGDGAEQDS
jgi:GAF domain-containing protein/HAMP domain-containing protein